MRIFVGPTEIAGIGQGLKVGFEELGHRCDLVTAIRHPFSYGPETSQSSVVRAWQWISEKIATLNKPRLHKIPLYVLRGVLRWMVVGVNIFKYDAFIFLYGSTITNTEFELWLLRRLKKRVIITYVGSDARPAYLDGAQLSGEQFSAQQLHQVVLNQKKRVALHERYADEIVSSHSIAQFSSRRLINWFEIGIPRLKVHREREARVADDAGTVTALHSPSNPVAKGTDAILKAVHNLKSKGIRVNLVMLQGVPNSEVISAIKKCDFVIDQLYSDTPMAGFATEAAHHGKPSVVGGYFAEEMHEYLRSEIIPPSEFVHPDRIEDAIEKLATNHEYRIALGKRAQDYVTERWSARRVAERYLLLLKGETPTNWYFNPRETAYVGGFALPVQASASRVRGLVEYYGESALGVDANPVLKKALDDLATTKGE